MPVFCISVFNNVSQNILCIKYVHKESWFAHQKKMAKSFSVMCLCNVVWCVKLSVQENNYGKGILQKEESNCHY